MRAALQERRWVRSGRRWVALWLGVLGVAGAVAADVTGDTVRVAAEEVRALRHQVEVLAKALAEARMEADSLAALLAERDTARSRAEVVDPEAATRALMDGVYVVDVKRDLSMVVLGAGKAQGMMPGMALVVLRGDRPVAQVRLVDVRRSLSGAVIERMERGRYPAQGDRVLMANQRE